MQFLVKQASVGALVALVAGVASAREAGATSPTGPKVVPGGYVVELESAANANALAFFSNVSSNEINVTPRLTLTHSLFDGISFIVAPEHDNETTFDTIQSFSSVKRIWPLRLYSRPATTITLSSALKEISSASLMKRDSDAYAVHSMGGVDKLRAEGYDGEGMFVAIIDTGVDYNHPLLGGGFGPGFKIAYGYDLVGDGYDGTNTPVPDDDPMDCLGHGTHVAGIVGANPSIDLGFSGVVPNATLGMWKVFGCYDNVGDDVLIAAFNMAYEAGADVITSSIGGNNGWSESAWDVTVTRIVQAGTPCTIAAGNDGQNGIFDTSGAGDAMGATGVGSIDSITSPIFAVAASYAVNGVEEADFPYLSATAAGDFGTTNLPLYAITLDTTITSDACSALDPSTPDLSSYVVLVRRGSCTFSSKIANVAAFGAKAVLIYNNADGLTTPTTTDPTIPAAMVLAAQGAKWISDLVSGLAVTIEFTALANSTTITAIGTNSLSGGTMSTFTSWGPTAEMFIKPEVSAPGGNILSTYLDGGYAVLSGTSMATPYIAGCVALIKQIKGKGISPVELNNLFSTTATPVKFNDGTGTQNFLTPVIQQGGGLVNAYVAAHYTSTLDKTNIPLNDTWNLVASHSFTLTNANSKPVTYKLSNTAAGTIYTFDPDTVDVPIPAPFPTEYEFNLTTSATIRFEPSASITIPGKSSTVIEAHFTAPKGLDASEYRIPMYSGFISISSSLGETLSLPYAGAVGILKHVPLWSRAWGPTFVDQNYNPVLANTTFILPGPNSTYIPTEVPLMSTALALACRIIRVDIVPLDTKGLPRVLGKQVLGAMPGYPYYYAVRQQLFESLWDGTLSTGEFVPKGTYKFLFRALSIFGDETYGPDWQSWESEYFNIEYA